jgi:anaerobic sulfite reductase subunit B
VRVADETTRGPMTPVLHRVVARRRETRDVVTISLEPLDGSPMEFEAGQFTMLTAFGVGEVPISVSSAPGESGPILQTVRDVGPVTHALCSAEPGSLVGVRGPFGTGWGINSQRDTTEAAAGHQDGQRDDVIAVAGGIGLAPLRGALRELLARDPSDSGRVFVLVGAREPAQVIYDDDLSAWARAGAYVATSVDVGTPEWDGHVGLVTALLDGVDFDPPSTTALVCGPEVMIRFTARALIEKGVHPARVRVSLERNMQCGVAWCGHCQFGPLLLCRDGPVVSYGGVVADLMSVRER